jgi:hypothetical protein
MARAIDAPLSPNQEVTLRRVALGIAERTELRAADLARLIHLQLVKEIDGRPALTAMGPQRYQLLPKAPDMQDAADTPAFVAVVKRGLRQDPRQR